MFDLKKDAPGSEVAGCRENNGTATACQTPLKTERARKGPRKWLSFGTVPLTALLIVFALAGCYGPLFGRGDPGTTMDIAGDNNDIMDSNADVLPEEWDITGRWEYRYTYKVEGEPRTSIEFDLVILSFDGEVVEGTYLYNVEDKPLMRPRRYSTDEESGYFSVQPGYQYISNLHSDDYGHVYDYYVELSDSTLDGLVQPCFIIDREEGILILTGHEQWSPLRPVTRVSQ